MILMPGWPRMRSLDHSGLPQKLTQLELSTLPEKPNAINLGILKRVLYKADNPDEYHLDLINDLRTTNLQIIEKLNGKENPAQEWAGISDVLSEREWADYLDLCNQKKQWDVQFRQKQEDVEKERLMQAEQASLDFLIFFQKKTIAKYSHWCVLERMIIKWRLFLIFLALHKQCL